MVELPGLPAHSGLVVALDEGRNVKAGRTDRTAAASSPDSSAGSAPCQNRDTVKELLQARRRRVGGESQIADSPGGFLLQEIADVVPGGIHVGVEELLLHAVEEIEVKVICPAARQLLFKYMFQVCPRLHVELGR